MRRGDAVYLRSYVEATPLRQLAGQQFRDQIGTVSAHLSYRALQVATLKIGFEPREGETLYQIELSERPIIPNANLYPYVLRDGTAEDLIRLGLRLAEIPELAFESWELPLLFANIDKHDRFFKVVDLHGEIVGI